MATVDDVLRALAGEGSTAEPADGHPGVFLLTSYRGSPVQPPARLLLTDADLQALLRVMATEDVHVLWPDVDVETGAYYMLVSLLDEEMERYDLMVDTLRVSADGVRATPRSGWHRQLPVAEGEDYSWESEGRSAR
jgi:hypothetical protein